MAALVVLRNQVIEPLLAAAQELQPPRRAQTPRALDRHYDTIRTAMGGVFQESGVAASTSTTILSGFALTRLTTAKNIRHQRSLDACMPAIIVIGNA